MKREVRKERTDWRDSKLDKIHNSFGYECLCENVEFLMIEYDGGTPVAPVDYRLKGRVNSEPSKSVIELCLYSSAWEPQFRAKEPYLENLLILFLRPLENIIL